MVFRNILISALVIVDILTIVRVTSYFYISDTYGVDTFNTTFQLKIQLKEINEGVLCHNKFLAHINSQGLGLITLSQVANYTAYSEYLK